MRLLSLTLPALLAIGCASYEAVFDVHLVAAEEADSARREGESGGVKTLGSGAKSVFIFEDETVSVFWMPRATRFEFKIANKSGGTIRIPWDEAAYVDEKGESRRVVHSGISPEDRNHAQPPSTVVRGGAIGDFLLPADRLESTGPFGKRVERPLFTEPSSDRDGLKAKAQTYVGKRVRVLLPMEIRGGGKEYIFTFEIRGFRIE